MRPQVALPTVQHVRRDHRARSPMADPRARVLKSLKLRWQVRLEHESGLSTPITQKIRRIKMHVTEKVVDENGVHILTSQIEADGPFAICSKDAKLEAKVIALQRTESGGVK